MLPLVILLAEPADHSFQPANPAPVVITPDNVELDGAGQFDFSPDPSLFHANPPAGQDGISTTVRLSFGTDGKPIGCETGQTMHMQLARTGCEQLMKSARFHLSQTFALQFRRGFVDVEFSFFKDPVAASPGEHMYALPMPAYANTSISYPTVDEYSGDLLTNEDGRLSVALQPEDYPAVALRYGFESRSSVLLGVSRDGKIQNCRPISAPSGPNTAFLDNYTCNLFARRGNFVFRPTAEPYDGLRYWKQSMVWKIPR